MSAIAEMVGNQSLMCINSRLTLPLCSEPMRGELTNPMVLMPPSQRVALIPLRGQLFPPNFGIPPLSGGVEELELGYLEKF